MSYSSPCFFFPVISLLFYVGILLISDAFVSVVQIHDSVMPRRFLFSLGLFSCRDDYSVFVNFPMLFFSYFLIIYLIYITMYMLIPNS